MECRVQSVTTVKTRSFFSALFVASLAASLLACGSTSEVGSSEADYTQDLDYELYFTDPLPGLIERNVSAFRSEEKRPVALELAANKVGNGDRPDEALAAFIDTATGEGCDVVLCDYDYDLQILSDALVRAKERGCTVRMITDGTTLDKADPNPERPQRKAPYKDVYEKPIKTIQDAGIEIRSDGPRGAIMHNKFVVLNHKDVWTGGWNMSLDDTFGFWNDAMLMRNVPQIAERYYVAFDRLWTEFENPLELPRRTKVEIPDPANHTVMVGETKFEIYFPRHEPALQRLAELALTAEKSVHVMAFSFTDSDLGDAIEDRAKAGVEVKAVFENVGSCNGQYRRLEELQGAAKENVQLLRWVYGPMNFMHHKIIIVDEKTVAFASFNFSDSANTSNDENLVIVENAKIAKTFEEEFRKVWAATSMVLVPDTCAKKEADRTEAPAAKEPEPAADTAP